MKKSILPTICFALLAFCFAPLAYAKSETGGSAQDVKKETKELITSLKKYSVAQKDKAAKKIDAALAKLDRRIDALESDIDRDWNKMSDTARQKTRASLRALRKERAKLAEWYGGMKNSSASAWEHMKQGFSDAYESINASWAKARNEYQSDKK